MYVVSVNPILQWINLNIEWQNWKFYFNIECLNELCSISTSCWIIFFNWRFLSTQYFGVSNFQLILNVTFIIEVLINLSFFTRSLTWFYTASLCEVCVFKATYVIYFNNLCEFPTLFLKFPHDICKNKFLFDQSQLQCKWIHQ